MTDEPEKPKTPGAFIRFVYEDMHYWGRELTRMLTLANAGGIAACLAAAPAFTGSDGVSKLMAIPLGLFILGVIASGVTMFSQLHSSTDLLFRLFEEDEGRDAITEPALGMSPERLRNVVRETGRAMIWTVPTSAFLFAAGALSAFAIFLLV